MTVFFTLITINSASVDVFPYLLNSTVEENSSSKRIIIAFSISAPQRRRDVESDEPVNYVSEMTT